MVSLMTAENASAVPTAAAGGTLKNSMRTGARREPAPTPVSPTPAAIRKPTRISVMDHSEVPRSVSAILARINPSCLWKLVRLVRNLQIAENRRPIRGRGGAMGGGGPPLRGLLGGGLCP